MRIPKKPIIKKRDIESFVKAANKLDSLMKRIRQYNPDAKYYLANDTLNLMNGHSHSAMKLGYMEPLYENVVESVVIESADGGDW